MRRHHEGGGPEEAVGQRGVDVVVALSLRGDEEGQRAVRRQHVHAPVLLAVPGHQGDAALLHVQVGGHRVQRLRAQGEEEEEMIRKVGVLACENVSRRRDKMEE